jgi:hypothetical protein
MPWLGPPAFNFDAGWSAVIAFNQAFKVLATVIVAAAPQC